MPQAIPAFLSAVGLFIVDTAAAIFGVDAAIAIITFAERVAAIELLGWVAGKLTRTPDVTQTAVSNSILVRGTIEHQRIIYGQVLVGGTIAYLNTAGTHNQSLYHAIVLAGHPINNITDMWIEDNVIPNAAIDWSGDGSVDSGWLRGNTALQTTTYFNKYLGTDNQTASAPLISAFAEITSQHQGRNIPYFVARFDYFEGQTQVWSAGVPQQIRGLVEGKLVYDPRSDSTQSFGTGPHRVNSIPTWQYSNNPALCWADYLIDQKLGMGVNPSKVDYGYVASAAQQCDGVVFTPVGTSVRYSCNGVLFTSTDHRGNIESILSSFNGSQCRVNGQYKLRAFAYSTPTLQFNEDQMRDDAQFQLDPDENDRYNTVRGVFIDKDRLWQSAQFPAFTSSEYVARDGGVKKYEDIQLPMTTDVYMAQRLAAGILERSDLPITVVYPSNFKALPVEINGTLKLSIAKMNWTDKEFRCVNYGLEDMRGVNLIMREESAAAYTDVGTAEYSVSSQGSYITANPGVPAPSSLWVSDTVNGTIVNWTQPPARLFETVEIWANSGSNVLSSALKIFEGKQDWYRHTLDAPASQYYWARSKNYAGAVSVFFPNSDATNVAGIGARYETLTDYTFDKGSHLNDFYDALGFVDNGFKALYVTSEGLQNSQAVRFVNSFTGDNLQDIVSRVNHQVITRSLEVNVHYRVNCSHGTAVGRIDSAGLALRALGWSILPLPARIPPALSTSGTLIVSDTKYFPVASLTATGSWATLTTVLSQNSSWLAGHKIGNFSFGIYDSVLANNSVYLDVVIDNVSMRYVG